MISTAKNSIKFQKTRFWEEKSLEDVVKLEPTAQATLVIIRFQTYELQVEIHLQQMVA